MGRKPTRAGKYFYICFTLLIFFSGCTLLPESNRRREMRESLLDGNSALVHGEYDASLKAFEKVLGWHRINHLRTSRRTAWD